MASVRVRYIVNDIDSAIAFYTEHLGFRVELHPGPGFAMLAHGDYPSGNPIELLEPRRS